MRPSLSTRNKQGVRNKQAANKVLATNKVHCEQVFRKLLLLDLKRLELIKMFLYCMKIEQGEDTRKGLERMQQRMHSAVDMALVTILAHYDKEYRKASRAGQLLTTTATSTQRVGGFLPHAMQEERDDLSLPPAGAGVPASSQPSGNLSMTGSQPVMNSTNVVWGPAGESTMDSAVSTIDEKSVKSNAEATPTAAEMNDVLEMFEETAADVQKNKEAEKQARTEKELGKKMNREGGGSGEIEGQGTPKRDKTGLREAKQSSPLKSQELRARTAARGESTVATADVTLSIHDGTNSRAATAHGGSQV